MKREVLMYAFYLGTEYRITAQQKTSEPSIKPSFVGPLGYYMYQSQHFTYNNLRHRAL